MELKITTDKVKEAAEKHPEAKDTLKTLFPDAFKPEPLYFGNEYRLSARASDPIFIGLDYAPGGLMEKCLIVHKDYRLEVTDYNGRQILTFYRK